MKTGLRYWLYRALGKRRKAGGIKAAQTRKDRKALRDSACATSEGVQHRGPVERAAEGGA